MEKVKPVNLPVSPADLIGKVPSVYSPRTDVSKGVDYMTKFNHLLSSGFEREGDVFKSVPTVGLDMSGRFPEIYPWLNNEEIYAERQTTGAKIVNAVGKGIALTGTTLLQGTVGAVNGLVQWEKTGKASSFYDNDFNRWVDNVTKDLDNRILPNYYTQAERDAEWYSPKKLFSANFIWDGIVKNLGFSVGTILSGMTWMGGITALSRALGVIPKAGKLFAMGKAGEAFSAVEADVAAMTAAGKATSSYGNILNASNKFISQFNLMNPGSRALVSGLSVSGEASFEAYHNLNEYRQNKIQEYKDSHGGMLPTGTDLEKINAGSEDVGNFSYMLNAGLLAATSYIQLPKILSSSYASEKGIINDLTRKIGKIVEKDGKFALAPTRGGKLLYTLNKIRPYTFSASEAFEEGSQYAITIGTQDYFDKKYKGEPADFMESMMLGVEETLGTNQGMENVLIGGLSGSLMMGPGRFRENRAKSAYTQDAIKRFNDYRLSNFTQDTFDAVKRGTYIQQQREGALVDGNIIDSKDLEHDYITNYLTPRIKYGRYDLVKSEIADYRQLASTEEGFAQLQAEGKALQTDTREAFLNRLNMFEQTAENVKSLYQSLNLRFGGIMDEKGKPKYSPVVIDKLVYAASKIADYDQRIPTLTPKLVAQGIQIDDVVADLIAGKVDKFNEAVDAITKIEDTTKRDDIGQALDDVAEMTLRRNKFLQEYDDIKKNPKKYDEVKAETAPITPIGSAVPPKETIKVKTKTGEKDLEIGTEYFAGKPVDFEKEGIDAPAKISRLTIIKENEDGTIKVKDQNGVEHDIKKETLLGYKVGKMSDTLKNKAARYFYHHMNEKFKYNFGKQYGGERVGRLIFEDGKFFFVYKNAKGEIERKQMFRSHFVAQEGFTEARLVRTGQYVETKEQKEAAEALKSAESLKEEQNMLAESRAQRISIISAIEKNLSKLITDKAKQISSKRQTLLNIEQDISDLYKTKESGKKKFEGRFGKILTVGKKTLAFLEGEKNNVEKEIEQLNNEVSDLQMNLSYFQDLSENISELPEDLKEMLDELKKQAEWLGDTIKGIEKSLSEVEGLHKGIVDAIKKTTNFLKKVINEHKADFADYELLRNDIKDTLSAISEGGDISASFAKLKDDIASYTLMMEDKDINEIISLELEDLQDVEDRLKALNEWYQEDKSRYNMLSTAIEKFQELYNNELRKKEEQKKIQKNKKLQKEFTDSFDDGVQTESDNKHIHEEISKKSDAHVVNSTSTNWENPPYQQRTDRFGVRWNSGDIKNPNLKLIHVTLNNLDKVPGLEKLIDFILPEDRRSDKYKAEEVIVGVIVQVDENGKNPVLVDEFGNPIQERNEKDELIDPLNHALFQVYPLGGLEAQYKDSNGQRVTGTMFRESTPEHVREELKKRYQTWRDSVLNQTEIFPVTFTPSFGFPEYVMTETGRTGKDGKPEKVVDINARTPVEESGLISPEMLGEKKVLEVATTNDKAVSGDMSIGVKPGRVVLKVPGKFVAKLNNRKLTEKEANTIYDVLLQITKNAVEEGSVGKGTKSERLFGWLKSVVYWGITHDAKTGQRKTGVNNIWFETVEEEGQFVSKLFISGDRQTSFEFTPSSLENNKVEIVNALKNIYNNVNAKLVNSESSVTASYFEITGIDENGNPVGRKWQNYQTYLLSNKIYEGGKVINRDNGDIPLVSRFRPLTGPEDFNRHAIYFTTDETVDDKVAAKPAGEVNAPPKKTEPKPAATPESAPEEIVLDGVKENTIHFNSFGGHDVKFKLDGKKFVETGEGFNITSIPQAFVDAVIADKKAKGEDFTKEQATNLIGNSVYKKIEPLLSRYKVPIEPSVKDETSPAKPEENAKETKQSQEGVDWSTATVSSLKKDLVEGKIEYISNDSEEEPGYFINFTYNQKEDETRERVVDVTEGFPETDIEVIEKGNYFNVDYIGDSKEFHESSTELDEIIQQVIDDNKKLLKQPIQEKKPEDITSKRASRPRSDKPDNIAFRLKILKEAERFEGENWTKIEEFIRKNFPNIPVYRVKNIMQASNGRQVWGMLQDASLYIYEHAEGGTIYHEVFEAVWKMMAGPKEKKVILKEFRNREGSYVDRFTGETIEYKNATDQQIKEEIAEEYRDYQHFGIAPDRSNGKSWISKLFHDIVNFIKTFFTGEQAVSNVQKLFDKIGNGYYAQYNPFESNLSFAKRGIIDVDDVAVLEGAELRVKGIPATQLHDIMQQMVYSTLTRLSKDNKSLFRVSDKLYREELYEALKSEIKNYVGYQLDVLDDAIAEGKTTAEKVSKKYNDLEDLYDKIDTTWDELFKKYEEKLLAYNIEFDENDEAILNDEDNSGRGEYQPSHKIDSFRKSPAAIKLLFATLAKTSDGVHHDPSSIGGVILMPPDQVYIQLLSKLHDAIDINDMFDKLRIMALGNLNYDALYKRLTKKSAKGSIDETSIDFSILEEHDLKLISAFWKTMKKQNADVLSVYILPGSDIVVSDSALNGAARQIKRTMINNIIDKIKNGTSYFKYESKTGKYSATTKVKNIKFDRANLGQYVEFLKELDIDFNVNDLKKKLTDNQRDVFRKAVEGMQISLSTLGPVYDKSGKPVMVDDKQVDNSITTISTKTLDIDGALMKLSTIKAILESPGLESTYFNINGERTQTFIGTNAISNFYDNLTKAKNISDLATTAYSFLLTDKFTMRRNEQGKLISSSVLLNRMFNLGPAGNGNRREGTVNLMHPVFVDGTIDEEKGKKKESSKLTHRQRMIQEIILNLDGVYSNLVPGDASLEHAVRMHYADSPFVNEDEYMNEEFLEIFKEYLISEIDLSRDDRRVVSGKNSRDLRFFKDILGEELNNKITSDDNLQFTAEELYEKNKTEINRAVKKFIEQDAKDTEDMLRGFSVIKESVEGLVADELPMFQDIENLTQAIIDKQLRMLSINYMIANIELHKLIYSDPFQYSQELKRTKSFDSPASPLMNTSRELRETMHRIFNRDYKDNKYAQTNFLRDHFRAITLADVYSNRDFIGYEDPYAETDGGGVITLKGNRLFGLLAGDWSDDNERQYKHDMEFERLVKTIKDKEKLKKALEAHEKNNPKVSSTYVPRKPIVRGSKANGRDYNDIVLHKFALPVSSFRILYKLNPESNALKLYNKMTEEDIDYAVYESGSKVGTEAVFSVYNENGEFNTAPFETQEMRDNINALQGISKIPFTIMAVQSEVPSKEGNKVTEGSQTRKIATMNFLEAGVPIDFDENNTDFNDRFTKWYDLTDREKLEQSELYKEIKHNQLILEEKINEGYRTILNRLGIKEEDGKYIIGDTDRMVKTLKEEILKREVNDNILDAFEGFKSGDTVIEATPAYQQIRNILYSIADKNVIRPKIKGGLKVQVPSSMLEANRIEAIKVKDKDGVERLVYASTELDFYSETVDESGKKKINVCEIMVARWFDSDMSDDELLRYLNTTSEGQRLLSGVAFRIPTQNKNSIDAFRVKKFLPKEFGDSVVVPSAIVRKVGSDFDIDKLSIYLKNVYKDAKDRVKLLPYYGIGEVAKNKFKQLYLETVKEKASTATGKVLKQEEQRELFRDIAFGQAKDETIWKWSLLFKEWFADEILPDGSLPMDRIEEIFESRITKLNKSIDKLTDRDVQEIIAEETAEQWYKESLENEYIESLERLTLHPANFQHLTRPNSAKEMKDITKKINAKIGIKEKDYKSVGNMLSRSFMNTLRHSFVTGKYAIGIAATGQTSFGQRQRVVSFINDDFIEGDTINPIDKTWLGDGKIRFREYNKIKINGVLRPVLSMMKSANGKDFISNINSQFIDGYVDISNHPWIIELGATPNVLPTYLFLLSLGVSKESVAYFMKQPIINKYLRNLENRGYSWLFIDGMVKDLKEQYKPSESIDITEIPSENDLYEMLEYNSHPENMSDLQKAQQQFMLGEFLKYAKMAEHLFYVTQASNLDTANINDPYLISQKNFQLNRARNTIISALNDKKEIAPAVDVIINGSFVGNLRNTMLDLRDAFGDTILISDRTRVRGLMEKVLAPYFHLNSKDFLKIAQKAVGDLFDWAMQNDKKFNEKIAEILAGTDKVKSAAEQIIHYRDSIIGNKAKGIEGKPDHPLYNNIILRSLKQQSGNRKGANNNLYIEARDTKVYDQNMIIYGFEELRETLRAENNLALYGKLVRIAILQSGVSNSPIAFTNLLPYEDFKLIYNDALSALEDNPNLSDFNTLRVFERNNYNNEDVAMFARAKMKHYYTAFDVWGKWGDVNTFFDKKLQKEFKKNNVPKLINISRFTQEARHDFLVYTWETSISNKERIKRRKSGDKSHVHKVLMQKVYEEEGKPLIHYDQFKNKEGELVVIPKYVYKAINAWGDSYRAKEMYGRTEDTAMIGRISALDNGFDKVERKITEDGIERTVSGEVHDGIIVDIFKEYEGKQKSIEKGDNIIEDINDIQKDELLEDYSQRTGETLGETRATAIQFKESSGGYVNRTIENASADATIAIAVDFNSAGEKLTKSSVLNQNKKYIPIDANTLTVTKERVDKIVEQLNSIREYTPENITILKTNEVFVFGANTAGGHGGGTAGLAQRGSTSSNYTALPIGTKGKWSEYGVVDKLMQGTEGKSFGIVTKAASITGTSLKIGSKRSVPLSRVEESINKLIKTANQNPNLKFLVTKFGTNMAGFSEKEMKSLLENKELPNNIILPKEFEVRGITLNIAGNGIYTMKGKYTQQQVDDFTYKLLNKILNSPNLKNKIESIRTGGQTGFDEAGAKAGIKLGIPTIINAPKGWMFRNEKGQDISSEKSFKERFKSISRNAPEGLPETKRPNKECKG